MKEKLKELISKFLKEYVGTGASGGNAGDGNNITSPRPFADDLEELENYLHKNIYGGEGGHYRKDADPFNYNRQKMGMFELKKFIKKTLKEQAYPHATLTTQGQAIHRAPGIMENRAQELADSYSLEELEARLKQIYREMEQEAEPEGGPIANQYADEIYQYEEAIRIAKGIGGREKSSQDKSYDEVYLKDKLVGIKDAYEYEVIKGKGRITIYPDLGSLQYKSRSTQEIVFTKDRGEIAFVRAFGYERSYDELKKILPELPEMGDSSFAGFMNVLPNSNIPVDIDTALEMIKAMVRGRDAESKAQSDFYGSRGPTSGTIDEQEDDNRAAKGTGQSDKKGPTPPKPKAHPHDPDDLKKNQIEMLNMQRDNLEVDIYNMKQNLKYQKQIKSTLPSDQQGAAAKQIAQMSKQNKELRKQIKQISKQISTMKKPTPTQKEGYIKASAKSLLNQYEEERGSSNLHEHMKSYKKEARRLVLMEGAMKKFFEYFDEGHTNEEIVQLYAQKGVSVPETFVGKARGQYENLKKLKLELETSEQNFRDVSKMMVNNAEGMHGEGMHGEGMHTEKQLASGITDK